MIYNSRNDVERSVQCRMMAAHLQPSSTELWISLGFQSLYVGV
jgi:hypothetical protein